MPHLHCQILALAAARFELARALVLLALARALELLALACALAAAQLQMTRDLDCYCAQLLQSLVHTLVVRFINTVIKN